MKNLDVEWAKLAAENRHVARLQFVNDKLTERNISFKPLSNIVLLGYAIGLFSCAIGLFRCFAVAGEVWYMCICAARAGHLRCLEYLLSKTNLADSVVCQTVAQNNHLDCLRYSVERGCEVDALTWEAVVSQPSTQCLEYLLSAFSDT